MRTDVALARRDFLAPDVVITGGSIQVRAERAGNGPGRVYTISATANDLAGTATTATATCPVPHDHPQTARPSADIPGDDSNPLSRGPTHARWHRRDQSFSIQGTRL